MNPVDDLPASIRSVIGDGPLEELAVGRDHGDVVYRSRLVDGDLVLLRSATTASAADDLEAEAARLRWLRGRAAAPVLLAFDRAGAQAWMLTSGFDGSPASEPQHLVDGPALARALALALREVHALDRAACPFDVGLAWRRQAAARRVERGAVDPAQFEPAYRGYSPARLLSLWNESDSGDQDLVVVHGAFTLDNAWVEAGRVTGLFDWTRSGVADRYVDLALAARGLALRSGPDVVIAFFEAYGIDHPQLGKLDFYLLADEFF